MAKGKKTGGRKAGTPNQITKELRESLSLVVQNEFEQLPSYLAKLDTKDRLELLVKMLPFVMPRMEPIISEEANMMQVNIPISQWAPPPIEWVKPSKVDEI